MAVPDATPAVSNGTEPAAQQPEFPRKKLHGREFYESIGCPKHIVAPMVDRSEYVSEPVSWRA